MDLRAEKWLLLALCAALSVGLSNQGSYAVVALIVSVVISALCEVLSDRRWRTALPCLSVLAAAFYPSLLYYLPVFSYDLWPLSHYAAPLFFLPALFAILRLGGLPLLLLPLLMVLAVLIKRQDILVKARSQDNHRLRDDAAELLSALRQTNSQLLRQQDDVAKLATLTERGRIARDIHDSVGHVLSSALLQTGAMMAVSSDEQDRERLWQLHDTLSEGMDEVRAALHQLRDEALDLELEISKLAQSFTFCPVRLEYDVRGEMPVQLRRDFAAIVKEGLANIARHSNATRAFIRIREHPAFYQLIISDNGRSRACADDKGGMGLENIRLRVEQLGGLTRIQAGAEGFEIFVSIRKESVV